MTATSFGGDSSRRRSTGLLLGVLLLAATLPACASGASTGSGTTRTVPVLWAGTDAEGATAGGVEKARVTVSTDSAGDPGFSLDLQSVRAKDAGPQWLAATSSAAAVATVLSATDPGAVAIRYAITGAIDGPSGGAILTVGTLAAIRGETLDPKVTMTGTISPDGSVGTISGVPTKLRGAAKAGFTKVLLPMTNLTSSGEASTTDMVAFGATLGLEVKGVKDVAAAYVEFTGRDVTPTSTGRYRDPDVVTAAGTATAVSLLGRLDADLATGPDTPSIVEIRAQRDRMRASLSAGRPAEAYAIGYDASTRLTEERAELDCADRQLAQGDEAMRSSLLAESAAIRGRAAAVLESDSQLEGLDPVAQLSLPFTLGWTTYADAIVAGIQNSFAGSAPPTPNAFCLVAATLAASRADIEVFQTDAMAVLRATPNPTVTTIRPAPEFLSDYTAFLISAGDANRTYMTAVLRAGSSTLTTSSGEPAYLLLALEQLAASAGTTPSSTQTLSEEIRQSAAAITYFAVGVGLVANAQSFGLVDPGISGDPSSATDIELMQNAVDNAGANVDNYADALAGRSVIPGAPAWSARWGTDAANALAGTDRAVAGKVTALNELWYDVLNVAVLFAATSSTS